jgi:hypothetical protein
MPYKDDILCGQFKPQINQPQIVRVRTSSAMPKSTVSIRKSSFLELQPRPKRTCPKVIPVDAAL